MNTHKSMLIAVSALGGLAFNCAQANLLLNADFGAETAYIGGTTSNITDWDVASPFVDATPQAYGGVYDASSEFSSGLVGTNAVTLNGGMSQSIGGSLTFVEGLTYTVSINAGRGAAFPTASSGQGFAFGLANAVIDDFLPSGMFFVGNADINAWTAGQMITLSFDYTATAFDDGNAITFYMTDYFSVDFDNRVYALNNASVTVVPEPAGLAALGLAAVAVHALRRRRRGAACSTL